jgi:hypothetical protein
MFLKCCSNIQMPYGGHRMPRLTASSATATEIGQAILETRRKRVDRHDESIGSILTAIRELMAPPEVPKRRIGFID